MLKKTSDLCPNSSFFLTSSIIRALQHYMMKFISSRARLLTVRFPSILALVAEEDPYERFDHPFQIVHILHAGGFHDSVA